MNAPAGDADRLQQVEAEIARLRNQVDSVVIQISHLMAEREAIIAQRRTHLTGQALATEALTDPAAAATLRTLTRAMHEAMLDIRRWSVNTAATVHGWAPVMTVTETTDVAALAAAVRTWCANYAPEDLPPEVARTSHHTLALARSVTPDHPLTPVWIRRDVDEAYSIDPLSRLRAVHHQHEGTLQDVLAALRGAR